MRAVFLGTPQAAVPTLDAVQDAGWDVPLVVCQPDRPVGRSRRLQAPPVKRRAQELGLPVYQPEKVRVRAFRERLESLAPDLLVVVAYGRILGPRALAVPRLGPVNVHFSLLPRYRGAAPVQWALVQGEAETGVTTMRMNSRLDEGDVLQVERLTIDPGEHAPELEARLAHVGASLLVRTGLGLADGTIEATPQDHSRATFAPPLSRADGQVDPAQTARELEGRIRGFDPWPGVWLRLGERRLRLRRGAAVDEETTAPIGTIVEASDDGIDVACGRGTRLRVTEIQLEGRRPACPRDAVNGRQLAVGDRVEALAAAAR